MNHFWEGFEKQAAMFPAVGKAVNTAIKAVKTKVKDMQKLPYDAGTQSSMRNGMKKIDGDLAR